jgi:hypothetical protein
MLAVQREMLTDNDEILLAAISPEAGLGVGDHNGAVCARFAILLHSISIISAEARARRLFKPDVR